MFCGEGLISNRISSETMLVIFVSPLRGYIFVSRLPWVYSLRSRTHGYYFVATPWLSNHTHAVYKLSNRVSGETMLAVDAARLEETLSSITTMNTRTTQTIILHKNRVSGETMLAVGETHGLRDHPNEFKPHSGGTALFVDGT